jgi:hypothetical protein
MPARSTLGDHSAAVPLSASTCDAPKRARAAQHAADVAGVLHAIEHHARDTGPHRRRRRQVDHETDAAPATPAC